MGFYIYIVTNLRHYVDLEGVALIDESDWLCEGLGGEVAVAVIMPVSNDRGEHVKLYDLGAT